MVYEKLKGLVVKLLNKLGSDAPIGILLIVAFTCVIVVFSMVFFNFQFGADIPYLEVKNSGPAAYWGQIGDFIGGILNPILSFLAFMAVIYSLRLQSQEVKAARDEAKATQDIQKKQNDTLDRQRKIFERQSFESVFFGLLEIHSRNATTIPYGSNKGPNVFWECSNEFNVDRIEARHKTDEEIVDLVYAKAENFYKEKLVPLGHYFRVLEELLDYVDSYGRETIKPMGVIGAAIASMWGMSDRKEIKARYGSIVRSVLSAAEVECLFMYGLTPAGKELKLLIEKYELLKNLPERYNLQVGAIRSLYDESAYGYEATPKSVKQTDTKDAEAHR